MLNKIFFMLSPSIRSLISNNGCLSILNSKWEMYLNFGICTPYAACRRYKYTNKKLKIVCAPINLHLFTQDRCFESIVNHADPKNSLDCILQDICTELTESHNKITDDQWINIMNGTLQKKRNWPIQLMSMLAYSSNKSNYAMVGHSLHAFIHKTEDLDQIRNNKIYWLLYSLFLSKQENLEDRAFEIVREKWGDINILDLKTGSILIEIYSNTSKWREALKFIPLIVEFSTNMNCDLHGPLFKSAIKEQDHKAVVDLMNMYSEDTSPSEANFKLIVESFNQNLIYMSKFLLLLKECEWIVSKSVVEKIHTFFNSYSKENWKSTLSKISKRGVCQNCGYKFDSIPEISDEQFAKLREEFLKKTLVRGDIFINSTPKEFERFKDFLDTSGNFDIVIDGLNMSYLRSSKINIKMFENLVKDLAVERRMKVLVVGRMSLKNWNKHGIKELQRYAKFFLISNISQDDPFMLYAALNSGKDTLICTNDFLRKESSKLGPELQKIFLFWQRGHQVNVNWPALKQGRDYIKWPDKHDTKVQNDENHWHIPYERKQVSRVVYKAPQDVLCIRKIII